MKHTNKIIAIFVIFLLVATIQTPQASAAGLFGGIGDIFNSIGDGLGKVADTISKMSTGEINAGEVIGSVVGGVITGVLTGTWNGLNNGVESIIRGTEFDVTYRKAKQTIRISLDEKYKLETLQQELKGLKTDFNTIKTDIANAGCTGTENIDFGVTTVVTPTTNTGGTTRPGGGTSGPPRGTKSTVSDARKKELETAAGDAAKKILDQFKSTLSK